MTAPRTDVAPFEYVEANVPFYPAGKQWGTMGEPIREMQKPLPPEEVGQASRHAGRVSVELFAAEPDIGRTDRLAWDERGRLWIAETVDYPNEMQPPGAGTRPHSHLRRHRRRRPGRQIHGLRRQAQSIPTSLVRSRGGVIVAQAPTCCS